MHEIRLKKRNIATIINNTWMKLPHIIQNGNLPYSLFKTRPQNWIWEIHKCLLHYFSRIYFGNAFCFLIDFCLGGVVCVTMKWLFSFSKQQKAWSYCQLCEPLKMPQDMFIISGDPGLLFLHSYECCMESGLDGISHNFLLNAVFLI